MKKRALTLGVFLAVAMAGAGVLLPWQPSVTGAAPGISSGAAVAGESTVTLDVPNMWCASCPYIVKQSLAKVDGVSSVNVFLFERTATATATVTFDDNRTNVAALMRATEEVGFPSTVRK